MAAEHSVPEQTRALATAQRHDNLCDEFEAGWRRGSPGRIEEFLSRVPTDQRPVLFTELLLVERFYRPLAGPEEFRVRFPQYESRVETAFYDPEVNTNDFSEVATRRREFIPPLIPGYEILGRLGAGGMGVVYRARQLDLDRLVAVKMIGGPSWSRAEDFLRFKREAEAVAGLNHPNVVQLYAFGQVDNEPYYVMELVEGGSLSTRLGGRPHDPEWVVPIIAVIARAMEYVHARSLIHRDLKPANILLAGNDVPKIADFGLVKRLSDTAPRLSDTIAMLGTPCYMAPEQADPTQPVGPAADIYSLGVILFEALTGRPPFPFDVWTVDRLLHEDPPRPSQLVPGLPADLDQVCLKCLQKQPACRYLTAAAFAESLDRFLRHEPIGPFEKELERDKRWARNIGFDVAGEFSSSAMAVTYVGRQISVDRPALLKRSTGGSGSPQHEALRREARLLASIDHPNVSRLYEWGERGEQAYLISEFPDGTVPLSEALSHSTGFTRRRAAEIILRATLGVQAIHDAGFVHGRLSADDVLLTPGDVPKICIIGPTPASAEAAPGADIAALGSMLRRLVSDELPPVLAAICHRCQSADPAVRFPSAGALALELQLFITGEMADDTQAPDDGDSVPERGCRLRIMAGPANVGQRIDLTRRRIVIGRRLDCDLPLADDPAVSRLHCGVTWNADAGHYELVDYGSRRGTRLNGRPVRAPTILVRGDDIQLAGYTLRFEASPSE